MSKEINTDLEHRKLEEREYLGVGSRKLQEGAEHFIMRRLATFTLHIMLLQKLTQ
jgi:hypothetical protein